MRYELETRFQQLQSRLAAVTLETEEVRPSIIIHHLIHQSVVHSIYPSITQVSKTLKATLAALLDSMCDSDCSPAPDVPSSLSHEPPGGGTAPKLALAKRRANQQETETYYFTVSHCKS